MGACDLGEATRGERRTEQVIRRLGAGLASHFAVADHLADGGEARPLMLFLQPADVGRDGCRAGLDPAMVGIDRGVRGLL